MAHGWYLEGPNEIYGHTGADPDNLRPPSTANWLEDGMTVKALTVTCTDYATPSEEPTDSPTEEPTEEPTEDPSE